MKKRQHVLSDDKRQNFKIFASVRTARALTAIKVVGNCGNRGNYEPDAESIKKIERALLDAIADTIKKLESGRADAPSTFKL